MTTPFLEPDQVGRQRFAVRALPGPRFLLVTVLVAAAGGLVGAAAESTATGAAVVLGVLLLQAVVIAVGVVEKHRVHDAGLVLGPVPGPGQPYVIPWSTVDPASLRVHRRANLVGDRYGPNGLSGNLRTALFATTAVSVTGLLPGLASPRRRSGTLRRLGIDPHLDLRGVDVGPAPRARWLMAVRDPEPLARAIEQAMLDAGLAAHGAADRALADPVVERRHGPQEQL